jgi:hypothetical protein
MAIFPTSPRPDAAAPPPAHAHATSALEPLDKGRPQQEAPPGRLEPVILPPGPPNYMVVTPFPVAPDETKRQS